jgi:hypothetical protein
MGYSNDLRVRVIQVVESGASPNPNLRASSDRSRSIGGTRSAICRFARLRHI